MGTRRWVSLTMLIATAVPWAVSLGILGLWILFSPHKTGFLSSDRVSIPLGVCSFAGGQLVFLMCIADRVFPKVPAALSRSVEAGLGAILLVGTVVLSVSVIGGGI